mgnify:CR=1 FL=1
MLITKLSSKLHQITVTEADLYYEGSIALDEVFLKESGMEEFERVDIYNINNGERFSTYILKAPQGSRQAMLNGAAARLVQVGDKVIVCAYRNYPPNGYQSPTVLLFQENNTFTHQSATKQHGGWA